MIRNYFKIAWRNLLRHKFISFINLFGLTVGLACCLLITAYIVRELSFDRYHKNADNIYRLTRDFYTPEGNISLRLSTVAPPFGHYMPSEFPEIEKMTRLLSIGNTPMVVDEKKFNESGMYVADEYLFDVFDVEVEAGDPATALRDPYSVMLTKESARKYFGDEDPMNKSIRFNNTFDVKVTGIYKAFPGNSHFRPDMLLSFNTLRDSTVYGENNLRTNWGNNAFSTYFLFPPEYDIRKTTERFPDFVDRHMKTVYGSMGAPSRLTRLDLQALTDIHLHSNLDDEGGRNGDIKRVYIFSAIALFILLIACINYMNLSTARSSLRAREIGIRKVVGAKRHSLVAQFLSESVLITLISMLLAIFIARALLPVINRLADQELSLGWLLHPSYLVPMLIAPLLLGMIAGIYPALFLSSFKPVKTLKGLLTFRGNTFAFRKVLVVFQFAISIILIVTTIIVFRQLDYLQSKSLGYDKEHVITFSMSSEVQNGYESFRQDMLQQSGIESVTRSSRVPTGRLLDNSGVSVRNGDSVMPVKADIKYVATDYDFLETYGIELKSGRYLSRDFGQDTLNYVLNEAALRALGWNTGNAIGQSFVYGGQQGQVIGVVSDFHFESLKQSIVPMVFLYPNSNQGFLNRMSVRIAGGDIRSSLGYIESVWKRHFPNTPFDYSFTDDNYKSLYKSEAMQASLFSFFSAVAIIIACLGLFGLSAFTISQRIREIGIRKVLGAGISQIVLLLSADFLKLVLIAAVVAFPVSWLVMSNWLGNFAYRTNLAWWVFVVAGALAVVVALGTISYLAVRAALANPVKSLRTE